METEAPEVKATRQLHDIAMGTGMSHAAVMSAAGIFKRLNDAEAERDAALAVISQALSVYEHWNWNDFPTKSDEEYFIQVKRILTQSPASALAKVKADALREGADGWLAATQPITGSRAANWLRAEAARLEKEADRG